MIIRLSIHKKIRLSVDKNDLPSFVTIHDIKLQVRNIVGDTIQVDCICDSKYTSKAIK